LSDDLEDTQEEEGVQVIVEDPTLADLALRLETSTLDLARLAGLRPELIMPGSSAWLLISNPAKVEEFMRIIALRLDSETQGQVDVAVWINDRGSVEWSEITKSSGRQEMDEAALALFNEVTSFRPARDRGVWVSRSVIFSVAFPW
jgi:TonB family protein